MMIARLHHPRAGVGFLLHAATIDRAKIGPRRNLTMPGISVTVAEQIAAPHRVAGVKAVKRIKRKQDPAVMKIVAGRPRDFDASWAVALGFKAEEGFDEIIRVHIEDELGGKVA
jgi:D-erythronate 2-dehydrogenase